MIPSPSTSTTIQDPSTSTTLHEQMILPRVERQPILDAETHLMQAQDIVLQLWTSALPVLDGSHTTRLVAAHRAINEARTMLARSTPVVGATID